MPTATIVWRQMQSLVDELNSVPGVGRIERHQQKATEKNISLRILAGPNTGDRLYVKPTSDGYRLALGTSALVTRMKPFMERLTGRTCDGYGFPALSREPYWDVVSYAAVLKAAYFFAGAKPADSRGELGVT